MSAPVEEVYMKATPDEEEGREDPRFRLVPQDKAHPSIPAPGKPRSLAWRMGIGFLKVVAGLLVVVFFVLSILTAFLGITAGAGRGRVA